ncbi:NDR1/HIN1-like protein 13 [Coffea eugenioides]|uniref:Uncharacterized protein n=1 Tax=Coffea arabica TaxID=13443 RepID=A0A6P6V8T8_COFAR|nr:NDR1/HIN1-like protein 13 [Coffea arabica]XP_027152611.1 NDR1/HIN1-like protein 13 [Coffea eugenioides]
MYPQHETNPHFLPQPPYPQLQEQRPRLPPQGPRHPDGHFTQPSPRPHDTHHPHFQPPLQPRPSRHHLPQPVIPPKTRTHRKHGGEMPLPQLHQGGHHFGQHGDDPEQDPRSQQGQGQQRPSPLPVNTTRKARPVAWIIAAFCTLFWIIVIVAGLAVLIIYLVYRPRLPKFDISTATLNAAYLDTGYLLEADLTILANFTNPNKKMNVDFSYVIMDLYYESNLIARRYVEPFTAHRGQSIFEDIHMVTSQVRLPIAPSQGLTRQMNSGGVKFDVKGLFRARSNLGGALRYSYWLYTHCIITLTGPPSGVLISKKCTTKR